MSDIGRTPGGNIPSTSIDNVSPVERLERLQGRPRVSGPQGPTIVRDSKSLSPRMREMLTALANNRTDIDDPSFQRLRQLYHKPTEQPPSVSQEITALITSFNNGTLASLGKEQPLAKPASSSPSAWLRNAALSVRAFLLPV